MNPEEFLAVARDLSRREDAGEGARRSTTSRAYYAAFNTIAQDLERHVGRLPRAGAHDRLIHWLRNSKVDGAEALADSLSDLRDRRVEADYFLERVTPTLNTVRLHLALAGGVIRDFQRLERPALYTGVRAYRRTIGEA